MKRAAHYVFVRHRHNWLQFLRFGLVGGSGVLVNQIVVIILNKLLGGDYRDVAFPLPFSDFNIRWYVVITTVAFLVANVWNFQLNRTWTFKSGKHAGWWREFFPFLAVGSVAYLVGQVIIQLLLWHGSPVELAKLFPVLDDSSGLRKPLYWANLIQITLTMPINFVVNKLWTFRAVRGKRLHPEQELPMVAAVVAPEVVDEEGNPIPEGTVHEDTIHDDSVRDGSGDTERG
ncbi:GtrA family protein [Enemella evansiae]|uniref:GtrA family protein n=1 Tax=Enemella evansiae TaxID=2016499 RepID=UPI000B961712|nr:GtrA family protein [Enemella evansiae]OYO05735.1 polysaccharide synthesis protein GtrA [Enemella evansiae]OYO20151.1 polysaccharide synthesis protein GtrA [Enemella evansiae]